MKKSLSLENQVITPMEEANPDVVYFSQNPDKHEKQKEFIQEVLGDSTLEYKSLPAGSSYQIETSSHTKEYPVGELGDTPEDDKYTEKECFTLNLTIDNQTFNPKTDLPKVFENTQTEYHEFLRQQGIDVKKDPIYAIQEELPLTIDSILIALSNANSLRLSGLIGRYKDAFNDPKLKKLVEDDLEIPIKVRWDSFESAQQLLATEQQKLADLLKSEKTSVQVVDEQKDIISDIEATICVALYKIAWSEKTSRYKVGGIKIDKENSQRQVNCVGIGRQNPLFAKKLFNIDLSNATRTGHMFEQGKLTNGKMLLLDHGKKIIVEPTPEGILNWQRKKRHMSVTILDRKAWEGWQSCAFEWMASWAIDENRWQDCIDFSEIGLERIPNAGSLIERAAYGNWGLAEIEKDKEKQEELFMKAFGLYEKLKNLAPFDPTNYQMQAHILYEMGELSEARKSYIKAQEINEKLVNSSYVNISHAKFLLNKIKDPKAANAIMKEVLEAKTDSYLLRYEYAMMLPELKPGKEVKQKQIELLTEAINICDNKTYKKKCKDARTKLTQPRGGKIKNSSFRGNPVYGESIRDDGMSVESIEDIMENVENLFGNFINPVQKRQEFEEEGERIRMVSLPDNTIEGGKTRSPNIPKKGNPDAEEVVDQLEAAELTLAGKGIKGHKAINKINELKDAVCARAESGGI